MCYRFRLGLEKYFDDDSTYDDFYDQYKLLNKDKIEIFPNDICPLLTSNGFIVKKWGLKGYDNKPIINAKSETIRQRSMFKNLINQNRCVIPILGFYEWSQGEKKQNYYFYNEDNIMYLACIYDKENFVVLTKEPNDSIKDIHNRMPIVLTNTLKDEYLNNPFAIDKISKETGIYLNHEIYNLK